MVEFTEASPGLLDQGMVILDGGKGMSKSKGDLVYLHEEVDKFGVDAVRLDHGVRRTAGRRHRLGRCGPGRLGELLARAWRVRP